ncbi:FAD-dependent oxidoreductase [Parapedobacter indicus]|uniref:FAD dependent oxidoreductase n=1 Tax=Parapedobacter indicus TaxID=1477437 RepID=A0A1I3PKX2_9SPHI|nr:FAD-dependent oxidoreductase [Parapedobacter indicus]PPL00487.1 FAD dependent oxidoreductase [Parapedobacter indicus]SFJ22000.1 FAD dependent oxidoreductase [Parapedobacter indicus]
MKIKEGYVAAGRNRQVIVRQADLIITGGGLSGVCAAITAARQGLKVVLVQDRPVLGGNASSEVRLWVLGATSHMGNNNRWAREGGVIDELLVENLYRNPEGNPIILDMILLDKVASEPNITLLLNTAVYEVEKSNPDTISGLKAFCSQNSTEYRLEAPLFCDASGDGIVGFLGGAAFRMGAESREEFDEPMAPDADYGELLGHSLYFYSKDTGKPIQFIPPSFAADVSKEIPRFRNFKANEHGCQLWWVEHGGRLDTVHDTEQIKWELWRVVYGIWDYIKNSGKFPEADTMTLEWVGMIPGKRESRRFEGEYMLSQRDLIEQRTHPDAVAYGGWSIDLHPADGVFSERQPCNQWHSKGVFQIPYRCLYSRNISNLFFAGRIISVSHVAFGATRVMATSAYVGQAVAIAATLCREKGITPGQLYHRGHMDQLQRELMKSGQHIPELALADDTADLVHEARIAVSSELAFSGFRDTDVSWKSLEISAAQLIPLPAGRVPAFMLAFRAEQDTELKVELRMSSRKGGFTPDITLASKNIALVAGDMRGQLDFDIELQDNQYVFLTFLKNSQVKLPYTEERITGLLSVFNGVNKAVSNHGKQLPPVDSGIDEFEFWCPQRRPGGQNIAIQLSEPVKLFDVDNVRNGIDRPVSGPNAWVADPADGAPKVTLSWPGPQSINRIQLVFDTDTDHPMESVLMTHPERVMPFCVRRYRIEDAAGTVVYQREGNYQTRNTIVFDRPVITDKLTVYVEHPSENIPASLFAIRCYGGAR